MNLGRRRGDIEKWLRKIMWGSDKSKYIVYIRHRSLEGVEDLKPIYGEEIDDIRHGYIITGGEYIPFHRVVEIRDKNGNIVYKRKKLL